MRAVARAIRRALVMWFSSGTDARRPLNAKIGHLADGAGHRVPTMASGHADVRAPRIEYQPSLCGSAQGAGDPIILGCIRSDPVGQTLSARTRQLTS